MFFEIFGLKDVALFDLWSIIHILSGIVIGYILFSILNKHNLDKNKKIGVIIILSLAYSWEILEYLFETGMFGNIIMNWFYSVEFLPNRLIIDPLTFLLGTFIIYKKPNKILFSSAIIISLTWLLIHIFIFPNVIYLQNLI